ncbi:glycosyl transferase family group 2-domain-containing protein [Mycena albidolilacea]|uniref:Glycosyl transferase family group 2-domain-containing protein n=1 Tax=Mycena albidolilacea TaxID=1033008 RepID=A0AAD6YWF5_9AGAR|nr:glycosyl transferase family group 2-domain-containing protein [Mycena albidolilacea]
MISAKPHLRTTTLYKILEYNYLIFPPALVLTFYVCYAFFRFQLDKLGVSTAGDWDWTTVVHVLLTSICTFTQVPPYANVWGLCLPMHPFAYARAPLKRSFKTLRICLVTKGTNFETVLNSVRQWEDLRRHTFLRFHVVIDDENCHELRKALPSFVQIIQVPGPGIFRTSKAKYKARALEFYRQQQNLSKEDWVLHLDEESLIDAASVQACLDFILGGEAHIGMGTIYYNGINHWQNSLLSAAEVTRISDDFGQFQLPVRICGRPLLGYMHGSWVLINGAVENAVTWETGCVAEDFWFAYSAVSRGYKFGWLHAIVREQPPETIRDFFRQRRRWYTGIFSIPNVFVRLSLMTSVIGPISFFVWPLFTFLRDRQPIPHWLFVWLLWNPVSHGYTIVVASVLQDLVTPGISWSSLIVHASKSVLLWPFVHLLQAFALVSCLWKPAKGFAVIAKS